MIKLPQSLCRALLLMCPVLAAAPSPEPPIPRQELSAAVSNRTLEQDYFAAEVQQPEHNLSRLGKLSPSSFDPTSPMPEAPPGHSAVVADAGLLYDNAHAALSYIGNVRLNDERVQLRAAHRLYIRLPENSHESREDEKAPAANTPAPATESPAAAAPGRPAPESKAAAQASRATPGLRPEAAAEPEPQIPAHVVAESAAVDLVESRFLLEGRLTTPSLTITRGSDSLFMDRAANGAGAKVYAGAQGDILLQGRNITFTWQDAEGGRWCLTVPAGPVYYRAARHCLVALGESRLTSPRYTMHAQRSLYIVFAPEEAGETGAGGTPGTEKKSPAPFSQFTTVRYRDIEQVSAYGNVELTSAAEGSTAPAVLRGESLHYEAASGECCVVGEPCTLEYGANTMQAPGAITLLGNGDALIDSSCISGIYERPFATSAQGAPSAIRGTYQAPGPITYNAQSNCVILPRGISAADDHGAFSCTGQLTAYLAPRPGAKAPKPPRPGMRLPNLTIASQGSISRLIAEGSVRLHSDASATTPAYRLECDSLEADLAHGTASLCSIHGHRTLARYGGYLLTAQSPRDSESSAYLLSNGDLSVSAATIHATMPGNDGPTRVDCTESLTLQRAQALLTLGPASCISTPSGILTARAPLKALLEEGEEAPQPSLQKKYPHLSYSYTGLRRADTPGGGTLRTPQASLECEGAIALELKPGARMQDNSSDARSLLRVASARDRVQVAGKDAEGRLMRAAGDRLDFDSASGNFYLRGRSVTLVDEHNSHTASGRGACITVDPRNNVHITGESHTTTASHVQQQIDNRKKK